MSGDPLKKSCTKGFLQRKAKGKRLQKEQRDVSVERARSPFLSTMNAPWDGICMNVIKSKSEGT